MRKLPSTNSNKTKKNMNGRVVLVSCAELKLVSKTRDKKAVHYIWERD